MNYNTILPTDRVIVDGVNSIKNFIRVSWFKDFHENTIKVKSILNLPSDYDDFFIEENKTANSSCVVSSIQIETHRKTIMVLY